MDEGRFRDPGEEVARDIGEDSPLIVARLREHDPAALQELYQQEQRRAFAVAMRVVGDASIAEDAVQEAFAQLWERADRISVQGGRVESLLMVIVRRRAIDLARRRGRAGRPLPDTELLEHIVEDAASMLDRVEEDLTTAGLRDALNAALAALPAEQGQIVRHAYFGGLTLREISDKEELPLGTVKSRLRLAMIKLTEAMQPRGQR